MTPSHNKYYKKYLKKNIRLFVYRIEAEYWDLNASPPPLKLYTGPRMRGAVVTPILAVVVLTMGLFSWVKDFFCISC